MPTLVRNAHVWTDQYFSDFIDTTTINGVFQIFRGRSKIRQIFWGLLFIGSFIGCIVTFGYSFRNFAQKPTASTIKVITQAQTGLAFPAVTICNLNIYQNPNYSNVLSSEMYALIQYLFETDDIFNEFNITSECKDLIDNASEDYGKESLYDMLLPKDYSSNLIYDCTFRDDALGDAMSCKDQFYPVLTPGGICYTFNGVRSEMIAPVIKSIGIKYGLKLVLNIEQETHPTFDGRTGVKVIIHERNDIPRPNLYGINVSPGQNIDIGVSRSFFIDETDQDKCNNDIEGNFPFLPNIVYSQFACRINQLYERLSQQRNCGCLPIPYRPESGPYTNTPNCTLGNLCCLLREFPIADASSTCQLPCNYSVYEYRDSYSSFPNGRALTEIARKVNMSKTDVKENFLSVNVFFEALHTTESITQYTYGAVDLLGELGGNMGLFLGISIISIMEVIMLILDEIKHLCPKKVKKKFDNIDDKLRNYIPDIAPSQTDTPNALEAGTEEVHVEDPSPSEADIKSNAEAIEES
ncbi:PREDICTED: acid-sensing ion channel 1-like [Amphimedon queenslandica]|uniref:Uncharacterized protein n=1 Tax=Amphimedon queenslandica TaxID=400682 RepID=A0A1X7UFI6_AMPQE|nr:PREDICTED: acid-sensing ion channel 1-like [Amphimedon queenslandica]|eukprot:XP_011405344.1 PREDICTED: acid-sensing ion channel 1-like [Amphimedon queenslandica]